MRGAKKAPGAECTRPPAVAGWVQAVARGVAPRRPSLLSGSRQSDKREYEVETSGSGRDRPGSAGGLRPGCGLPAACGPSSGQWEAGSRPRREATRPEGVQEHGQSKGHSLLREEKGKA